MESTINPLIIFMGMLTQTKMILKFSLFELYCKYKIAFHSTLIYLDCQNFNEQLNLVLRKLDILFILIYVIVNKGPVVSSPTIIN